MTLSSCSLLVRHEGWELSVAFTNAVNTETATEIPKHKPSARLRSTLEQVYMYLFEWPLPMEGGRLKAAHGAKIPFVFNNLDEGHNWGASKSDGAHRLADQVSGAWAAFARTGNPNLAGLPHWPAYDPSTRATMIFNGECRVENGPSKAERVALSSLRGS